MAISEIKRRIDKVERENAADHTDLNILKLIRAGAYYDELTEEEKELYAQHWKIERKTLEDVNVNVIGSLHFQLTRLVPARTLSRLDEHIQEVEKIINTQEENGKDEEQ